MIHWESQLFAQFRNIASFSRKVLQQPKLSQYCLIPSSSLKTALIFSNHFPSFHKRKKRPNLAICQGQYLFALNNINLLRLYNSTCSPQMGERGQTCSFSSQGIVTIATDSRARFRGMLHHGQTKLERWSKKEDWISSDLRSACVFTHCGFPYQLICSSGCTLSVLCLKVRQHPAKQMLWEKYFPSLLFLSPSAVGAVLNGSI